MKLVYWMYVGFVYIGILCVVSFFKNVYVIMYVFFGDDYFNVMCFMLERERNYIFVIVSVVDWNVLVWGF